MMVAPTRSTSRLAAFEVDGRWKNWLVEVKATHNLRDIRGTLLALAYLLTEEAPSKQAVCVLVGSKITQERLAAELEMFRTVVNPALGMRVHLAQVTGDQVVGLRSPGRGFAEWLHELVRKETATVGRPNSSQQAVLTYLLRSWLATGRPQTTASIQEAVGASYPTVAAMLKELDGDGLLTRSSDRRVALRSPSPSQWRKWIAANASIRKSVRFIDPAQMARTPESMAKRLFRLQRHDVAVGGVLGAKHYFPDLNITGSIRLDLTVHGAHLDFIGKLDPGLVETEDRQAKAPVVVHFAHGPEPSFLRDDAGVWADPLECVTDLHELGLDEQADEMLQHLVRQRETLPSARHIETWH
jgi:DNA-binding MarR family transcriptional regulator